MRSFSYGFAFNLIRLNLDLFVHYLYRLFAYHELLLPLLTIHAKICNSIGAMFFGVVANLGAFRYFSAFLCYFCVLVTCFICVIIFSKTTHGSIPLSCIIVLTGIVFFFHFTTLLLRQSFCNKFDFFAITI